MSLPPEGAFVPAETSDAIRPRGTSGQLCRRQTPRKMLSIRSCGARQPHLVADGIASVEALHDHPTTARLYQRSATRRPTLRPQSKRMAFMFTPRCPGRRRLCRFRRLGRASVGGCPTMSRRVCRAARSRLHLCSYPRAQQDGSRVAILTASTAELLDAWVNESPVVYIGKARKLRRRLREHRDHGQGKPVGH